MSDPQPCKYRSPNGLCLSPRCTCSDIRRQRRDIRAEAREAAAKALEGHKPFTERLTPEQQAGMISMATCTVGKWNG